MMDPLPLHVGHEVIWENCPKALRWERRTCPIPRQVVQMLVLVPGSLPVP